MIKFGHKETSKPARFIDCCLFGQKTRLHLRTFIRLVDKTIGEYQAARTGLIREVESEAEREASFILHVPFIDHIENCIMSARRLFRMMETLRQAHPDFVSRETRRRLERFSRHIRELREVIAHLAEDIHADAIEPNQPVLLNLSADKTAIAIGSQTLELHRLGTALREIHHLAKSLLSPCRLVPATIMLDLENPFGIGERSRL